MTAPPPSPAPERGTGADRRRSRDRIRWLARTAPAGGVLAGAATLAAGALATIFSLWTASSGWSSLRFLLAVIALFLLPGWGLLTLCRVRASLLEAIPIALLLGAALTAAAYWLLMRLGAASAIRWLPWALAGSAVLVLRSGMVIINRPRPRWVHVGLFGLMVAVLIPLLMSTRAYRDLATRADGEIGLDLPEDLAFHLAYSHELVRSVPPQVPFGAGVAATYHYGSHLLAAALSRTLGLEVADLVLRYLPTLWMALGVVAGFCCFRRILHCGEGGALLATLLVFAGEDFSFLPGLARGARGSQWLYFSSPTLHSFPRDSSWEAGADQSAALRLLRRTPGFSVYDTSHGPARDISRDPIRDPARHPSRATSHPVEAAALLPPWR